MQAVIATQAPPADGNKIMRTTMMMVVVLLVATVPTGVAVLVGKLVDVLEAA